MLGLSGGNTQLALFAVATQIPAKLMQLLQMTTEPLLKYFLTSAFKTSSTIKSSLVSSIMVGVGLLLINLNSEILFRDMIKLEDYNLKRP